VDGVDEGQIDELVTEDRNVVLKGAHGQLKRMVDSLQINPSKFRPDLIRLKGEKPSARIRPQPREPVHPRYAECRAELHDDLRLEAPRQHDVKGTKDVVGLDLIGRPGCARIRSVALP
jgi:hypothetical protein